MWHPWGMGIGMLFMLLLWIITIVGIVFTYVRARTGSTLATYLLHLGYNGIIFVFTLIATRGFRHLPGQ